jgi:tetratricopeptide (TPR) repeat protein
MRRFARASPAGAFLFLVALWPGILAAGSIVFAPQRDYLRLPEKDDEVDRAITCFEQGDPNGCLEHLKAAVRANPTFSPARVLLGKLYLLHDQVAPGRAELERAAVEGPPHPDLHLVFGYLALDDARLTDAWLQFEKAASLATASGMSAEGWQGWQARVQAGLAAVAERRLDWPAAVSALEAWLKAEPNSARALYRLGQAVYRLGRYEKAFDYLRRACEADPALEPAAATMGRLYTETGNLEKAAEWFKYGLDIAPKDPRVRIAYAAWLLDRGEPLADAQRQADAAAQLGSKSPELRLLQGLIAWQAGRFADAERLFLVLHDESPSNFEAMNYLALALAEQDDAAKRQRGLELAEINARLHPNSGEALTTLGWVNHRLGRRKLAEQTLRAAIPTGSAIPETLYYLARLLEGQSGDAEEIKRYLRLALDAPGRFAFRKNAREQLDRLQGKPGNQDGSR